MDTDLIVDAEPNTNLDQALFQLLYNYYLTGCFILGFSSFRVENCVGEESKTCDHCNLAITVIT